MFTATGKTRATLQALALVGIAIGLSGNNALAQASRQTCINESGDKAIAACTAAIKANSSDAEVYLSRGSEFARKGENDRAIVDYNYALQLNPQYALAYYNRALARESKGDLGPALSDFRKVLELTPGDTDAQRSITRLSAAIADKEKAAAGSGGSRSMFGGVLSRSNPNDDYTASASASSSGNSTSTSRLEALERLGKLRNSGVLTKQEFEREKARILKE